MSNKKLRDLLRIGHIIAGVMIIIFVYSSTLREDAVYSMLIQFVIIPAVSISGLMLWQQPLLNKWRKRSSGNASQ